LRIEYVGLSVMQVKFMLGSLILLHLKGLE